MDQRLHNLFLKLLPLEGLSGRETAVADHIRSFLAGLGLDAWEDAAGRATGGERGNLICPVGGGGDMVLVAHMDTARPTQALVVLDDGQSYRSAGKTILGADNRAGVAVLLRTTERVAAGEIKTPGFTLVFTVSEKSHLAGSKEFIPPEGITMGVIFDSSLRPGNIVAQGYGAMEINALFRGRAAHAGIAPKRGVNAILAAARAVAAIPQGRIDKNSTTNIGVINGGTATNMVAAETRLRGEVRALHPERVKKIVEEIREHFTRAATATGATLEFNADWCFEPFLIGPYEGVYRRAAAAITAAGLTPTPTTTPGGSDANALNAKGLPAVNLGIGAQNPHADDEFILHADLDAVGRIAANLVRS